MCVCVCNLHSRYIYLFLTVIKNNFLSKQLLTSILLSITYIFNEEYYKIKNL